ncbi:hypothetical protein ACJMK2_039449 [Sinanodonta woodiana]|uniref:CHAT domain-containing protein n=1 Tax=Sinanodonta woodiana TaxID=1069815 RepID=A0ABD3WC59_SINWO
MKSLREQGDNALKVGNYLEAINYYNEALEIDDKNKEVLMARATAQLKLGDYISAEKDVIILLAADPDSPQIHRLRGLVLMKLQQYKEALTSFLTALDLNPDNGDELTDFIAEVSAKFCNISEDYMQTIKDMDAYKKMSEVGVCLFQAKKYKLCIKILEVAQRFQTNQKGITMRIYLTLANAYSAQGNNDEAIGLYEECLSMAIATHDQLYQTKALVSIATLHLENKDIHQAIIYYERLLYLEAELIPEEGSADNLPDFWTKELQCGIHLNLSIAYKSIADMHSAIRHAKLYVKLVEKYNFQGKLKAESYHNTGMLNEILGNYKEAIKNYSEYLQESKRTGDKKGMAQAYGCLGSVYAALKNWKLSIIYHEQNIAIVTRFDDKRMLTVANEMLADTYMLQNNFEKAVSYYEEMLNSCTRSDYRVKAVGFCKLGKAYRSMNKNQYSLYFFEQSSDMADDFDFPDIKTLSEFNIACIQQDSTQMMDIEQAHKYFVKLIPFFESKIREHTDEGSHCPEEYHLQLRECYDGIQNVLTKLGNKEDCLMYAEAYRKRHLTQMHNYQAAIVRTSHPSGPLWDMWEMDKINRVVSQQNATVLYYSLFKSALLLWVLQPTNGLVRFYSKKALGDSDFIQEIQSLLDEFRKDCDWKKMQTECENRALPLQQQELQMVRQKYQSLSSTHQAELQPSSRIPDSIPTVVFDEKAKQSASRKLYNLLFSPVEDILSKLEANSNLIIIPDKVLHHCPFGVLRDWMNRYAFERFNITCLPSLLLLEKVVMNEFSYLHAQDECEFERMQCRHGGVWKYLTNNIISRCLSPGNDGVPLHSMAQINPRSVSNPRLLTSLGSRTPVPPPKPGMLERETTKYEEDMCHSARRARTRPKLLSDIAETTRSSIEIENPHPGSPTPIDKMLSVGTYSTLTTKTSTGTDITSSNLVITQFRQISGKDRCMVIGSPQLPESMNLHDSTWKPGLIGMAAAKREVLAVADYMEVVPLMGPDATKENFLFEVQQATVIHIATYGCWQKGLLCMTPNPVQVWDGTAPESSYLITSDEILGLHLIAQLVVLSVGHGPDRKTPLQAGYPLPSVFLSAGAQCVLVCLWPLPNMVMEKFYYHFYMALQNGTKATAAASAAIKAVKEDNRYSSPFFWSAFALIGKDVYIDLGQVRHTMLDQTISRSEARVQEEIGRDYLNPKVILPQVPKKEENLKQLQLILGLLLQHHKRQSEVLPELIDLLDSALKRLHTEENNKQTTILSENITKGAGGLDLLKLLGFHFQASGINLTNPYVVYPHWNKDGLLIPTFDALRALLEISAHPLCVQTICDLLPTSQDNISLAVDMLSLTKHAPEIQLKVTDLSVRPLWANIKIKKVLTSIGFHQIGLLLNFNRTPVNRQLLTDLLQLLLAVSEYKSQVLLYRLDVNLLGSANHSMTSVYPEYSKLPSLTPLILPRNQLRMSTPWVSMAETTDEMNEKIKLARSHSDLEEEFKSQLSRAKTWHQMTVVAQANETLSKVGRPQTSPNKIKVISGSTASMQRMKIEQEPLMAIPEVDQRRDYANYVLQQRVESIGLQHKNDILKLYLPYIHSS